MKCENRHIALPDRHLARMVRSAAYFGFACDEEMLLGAVRRHAETRPADGTPGWGRRLPAAGRMPCGPFFPGLARPVTDGLEGCDCLLLE